MERNTPLEADQIGCETNLQKDVRLLGTKDNTNAKDVGLKGWEGCNILMENIIEI
jgi:hypothetical protein